MSKLPRRTRQAASKPWWSRNQNPATTKYLYVSVEPTNARVARRCSEAAMRDEGVGHKCCLAQKAPFPSRRPRCQS